MTLSWLAWDLTASPGLVGFLAFVGLIPTLCLSLVFGVMTDRVDLIRASRLLQVAFLSVSLALMVLWATDHLSPQSLCLIALLQGTVSAAFNPVRMATGPLLAEQRYLSSVVALGSVNLNVARMTGPALSGLAIGLLGVGGALLVQATLLVPNFLVLKRITPRTRSFSSACSSGAVQDLLEGARLAAGTPVIRQALLLSIIYGLLARSIMDILPVIAGGTFDRGPEALGALASSAGAGALLGGFYSALTRSDPGLGQELGPVPGLSSGAVFGCLLAMAAVAVLGISQIWPVSVMSVFVLGFCSSSTAISFVTAINLSIQDHMRGRMGSLWLTSGIGSAALGALVIGAAIEWVGPTVALLVSAGLGFGLTVAVSTFPAQHRGR